MKLPSSLQFNQCYSRLYQLATLACDCLDSTVAWGPDRHFHLHGLEHEEEVALRDNLPFADVNRGDGRRHRRRKRHLVVVRALSTAVGAAGDVDDVHPPVDEHPSLFGRACGISEALPCAVGDAVSAVAERRDLQTWRARASRALSHASLAVSPTDRP